MRIGVSAVGVSQHGAGGVDRYLFETLRHAVESDHTFVIFGSHSDVPPEISDRPNVQVVDVAPRWRFGVGRILWHLTAALLEIARHRIDVFWIPNNRLVLFKNSPIVMTVHDLAEFAIPGKYSPLRMLYRRLLMRIAVRRVDALLTDSHHSAVDLQTIMSIPAEKITAIHLGHSIPAQATAHDVDAICTRYGLSAPFVLAVGRLEHPAKNLIMAMDVVAQVRRATNRDITFAIVGVDSWRADRIRAHATERGYDFVRFLGFVGDNELSALYSAASVLLFLSLYEGFGLPPLEAMTHGTPVVCSRASSLPEVVGDAALLVDPIDHDAAAQALTQVLTDPQLSARLAESGHRQAAMFSWAETARKTLSVLERSGR